MENNTYKIVSGSECNGSKSLLINVFGKTLIVWGISKPNDDLINQLDLITSISDSSPEILNHLKLNGFDVNLA